MSISTFDASKWFDEWAQSVRSSLLALQPAIRDFGNGLREFDAVVERSYVAAGQPYGPTQEGRYRWLQEVAVQMHEEEDMTLQNEWECVLLILSLRLFFGERVHRVP